MFHILRKLDWWLFGSVTVIFFASLLNLYGIGKFDTLFLKQLLLIGGGLAVMFLFVSIDYRILRQSSLLSIIFYAVIIILLLATLGAPQVRGVKAWLFIGSLAIEPSEFAKIVLIIFLAKFFSYRTRGVAESSSVIISFLYVLIPMGLVLLQPDLGSGIVLGTLWIGSIFIFGFRPKNLLFLSGIIVISLFMSWSFFLAPYQKLRILNFINPGQDILGSGFQNFQSQISVGSGGFWGYGIGSGSQVNSGYLSEPTNDFAVAAFAQQFGFIGIAMLLALYGILFFRLASISSRSSNVFAHHFSFLYFLFILTHFTINIGMNVGLLPVTGIPLSFFSYGGSHFISLMSGLGIMQSIHARG